MREMSKEDIEREVRHETAMWRAIGSIETGASFLRVGAADRDSVLSTIKEMAKEVEWRVEQLQAMEEGK